MSANAVDLVCCSGSRPVVGEMESGGSIDEATSWARDRDMRTMFPFCTRRLHVCSVSIVLCSIGSHVFHSRQLTAADYIPLCECRDSALDHRLRLWDHPGSRVRAAHACDDGSTDNLRRAAFCIGMVFTTWALKR